MVTAFVAALKALLAAAGFMRWSWVYVLGMVLLALSALSTLGTLLLVPSLATSRTILGRALIPVVLDLGDLPVRMDGGGGQPLRDLGLPQDPDRRLKAQPAGEARESPQQGLPPLRWPRWPRGALPLPQQLALEPGSGGYRATGAGASAPRARPPRPPSMPPSSSRAVSRRRWSPAPGSGCRPSRKDAERDFGKASRKGRKLLSVRRSTHSGLPVVTERPSGEPPWRAVISPKKSPVCTWRPPGRAGSPSRCHRAPRRRSPMPSSLSSRIRVFPGKPSLIHPTGQFLELSVRGQRKRPHFSICLVGPF